MKGQAYFDLLEIIKNQDRLENLGKRLQKAARKLEKRKMVLSPSDRPHETFEASERIDD